MTINPTTYGFWKKKSYYYGIHAKGEIWAIILFEVFWTVAEELGLDLDWVNGRGGNTIVLQNIVDGLKLQPCRPTFVHARDAILLADVVNYGGKHLCLLWKGFAMRGLGVGSRPNGHEDFSVPDYCQ